MHVVGAVLPEGAAKMFQPYAAAMPQAADSSKIESYS